MLKLLLTFLLTQSIAFSCALCVLYSPQTNVQVDVKTDENTVTHIEFNWEFSDSFTQQLISIYDSDLDEYLNKKELGMIQQALVDYALPKKFMTHISYGNVVDKNKSDSFEVSGYKTYIKNDLLNFKFTADVHYLIKENNSLYISVNDDENYFILLMDKRFQVFKHKSEINKIVIRQSTLFTINQAADVTPKSVTEPKRPKAKESIKEKTYLEEFTDAVKKNLQKVKQGDSYALVTLMFISFVYGLIHAMGPGHGKTLTMAYFTAHKSSYMKAFFISFGTAFVHIIGAIILVMVSYFILNTFLNQFVQDTLFWLTNISAIMIILLAIYIFILKCRKTQCSCSSCGCSSHGENRKRDLFFVLTAGLIPCTGTVILFIYAFILKTYLAVALAAVFISLGMGVIIFASSFLGVSLQKVSRQSHKITRILEIGSPIVMFILGVLLLLSTIL